MKSKSVFANLEGSSFERINPNGPLISSASNFFSVFSAASLARVFFAILNFAEESFKAFLKELKSETELPLYSAIIIVSELLNRSASSSTCSIFFFVGMIFPKKKPVLYKTG